MTTNLAIPAAPVINSVTCNSGGTLPSFGLTWTIQQGFTGPFAVVVTDSAGNTIPGNTTAASVNGATWTATASMDAATTAYYVQVAATKGIVSDKAPLLFAPVGGITTRFDGTTLSVGWAAPESAMPAGQVQLLLLTPNGAQGTLVANGNYAELAVDGNLRNAGGDWTLYLIPQQGISSGPQGTAATVYHTAPTVQSAAVLGTADGASASISAVNLGLNIMIPGTAVPETSFVAVLMANGVPVQTSAPFTGTWQHGSDASFCLAKVQFNAAFNLGLGYQVAVAQSAATAGAAIGPSGMACALVLLPPQQVSATVTASGNDRVVTADVTPSPGPWTLTGAQIAVRGSSGNPQFAGGYGFVQSLKLSQPTIGGAYVLDAAQCAGTSVGPWTGNVGAAAGNGTGLPLVTSIPVITSIDVDGGIASVSWGTIADAGVTGYRVSATMAGHLVASGVFTASASLAVTVDGASFAISGVTPNVIGPAGEPVIAITAAPGALSAAWTSTGADGSLSWQAPGGSGAPADGYAIQIYHGETLVHEDTTTHVSWPVLAGLLTAAGGYSFRVRATRSGTPALRGPWSTTAPLLATAPAGLSVDYNGATLNASWAPVPGATGYRVVLLANGAETVQPWFTAGPATSVSLALDSAKSYSLAVQATGPGATGPAATAGVFGAGFYPQLAANTAPALIPASTPAMAAHVIEIGLPQIFTSPPDPGNLPVEAPFSVVPGSAPYAYVLKIDGTAGALPWTFGADAVRQDLYEAYSKFLGKFENIASAAGIQVVQDAIARAMPQTFAETLLYTYGFDAASGCTDLKPGMVLRVEYQSYQTMGPGVPDQAFLNGFITSAVAEYEIARADGNGDSFTAFDAFFGRLAAAGGTHITTPVVSNRRQAGGGGLVDSGYDLLRQPFLRLVYPSDFPATDQPGVAYPEFNAVLLGAPTRTAMENATTNIRSGNAAGDGIGVLYFRGRTTLVPQVRVWVNGVAQTVPLGTTVGGILAQRGMEPPAVNLPLTGIRMRRGIGPALVGSPAVYDTGAAAAVRLDWAPAGNAALSTLPLLGGDRIDLGPQGAA